MSYVLDILDSVLVLQEEYVNLNHKINILCGSAKTHHNSRDYNIHLAESQHCKYQKLGSPLTGIVKVGVDHSDRHISMLLISNGHHGKAEEEYGSYAQGN